ncbi:N-acetylglucosamine/diacetylchitobiose ABC transporter substrate-binding protein [Humibacter ginsenosidimutans]|uniref:Carbohydrate ABC transporter, N-acetylglucosamine/diacetylchitobiose-binding protein n=1 Tax=Humibacter ginsenosidimutans TaxID=2599293 RepID=A0A5B8M2H9_9MICO|nr:N-acetylglucosamine/diacetylchitobiose ABC transporter substrate-binding protein [Humibacter ginsenosidimutans]QDZ14436.1 carbohydrate ABC transporter, N-acetylglucosamine/diacetylchitobiose-binding protein [Humibacter ginsenosidimutans]
MTTQKSGVDRRTFLRGAFAAAVAVPVTVSLASCSSGGGDTGSGGTKSSSNPFGIKESSSIEAVVFNGGYGYDYVQYAANLVDKKWKTKAKVTPQTNIAQSLQPRFVGGNPPDLIDNSGANQIGFNTILKSLETLDDVFEANNYEGKKISSTLYPNVKDPGTFSNKFVAMNYVMTVYAIWYSASLFEENGWTPPKTYDEALDLGAKAKAKGKYLFVWGKEAATYYLTMALDSAIKEGGLDVMNAVNNLEKNAWSQQPIQDVFNALEKIVKAGYFIPGGAGTQFTAAQAKWSNDQQALLYPSGGWIENEMKNATKAGFKMTGAPEPTVTDSPKLPYEALRAAAGEPYIVPSQGKNVAGGKEIMRAMLSKDAATNFSKTRLAPTIVKGLVPSDGFGSTALVSQTTMLDKAGSNIFDWEFASLYGLNTDQLVIWNAFLSGQATAAQLTTQMQKISDNAAASK